MNTSEHIIITGAGLVGSLQALFLARKGYSVSIYERRPDMRLNRMSAGRSINLALSDRGFRALDKVGIADEIRKIGIPMPGRMMHDMQGNLTYQPYGDEGQAIYSVSRGGLNCRLMDLAEESGVKIYFNQRCVEVDLDHASIVVEGPDGIKKIAGDRLIGADGAFSEVRNTLQKTNRFNYSQHYIDHGYKELTIEANPDGSPKMELNALHIWPRGEFMMIALPNPDNSFTCTLFFPLDGPVSFESLKTADQVKAFFQEVFPDTIELMPDLTREYFINPTSSMVIVKCFPWTWNDKVMLTGDAAHAIVPFYGQGMNCGFEDCSVFDELMEEKGTENWLDLFKTFEQMRKPDADAIAELALANFIEMRDRVADPSFLLQKRIEARFSKLHPTKWVPLYTMVTFSHTRYHEAQRNGFRQEEIMQSVMALPEIESKWDSDEVEQLILSKLN